VPNLGGGPYFGGSYEGILNSPGGLMFTGRLIGEGFGTTTIPATPTTERKG
jgi:hypothetical protein